MKIITEPTVHILSTPIFYPHPEYQLPDDGEEDGYKLIAQAGKVCYDSYGVDGRSIKEHIRNLHATRHGSVFEHTVVSLQLSGISRGLSHELVRHRHFAYSQRSTRYTKEEGAAIVLDPYFAKLYNESYENGNDWHKWEEDCHTALDIFLHSCMSSLEDYSNISEILTKKAKENGLYSEEGSHTTKIRKWARGKARQLLPHALETRVVMTGSIRSWRWFIELRSDASAEEEIRRLTYEVFVKLEDTFPLLFEDFRQAIVPGYTPVLVPLVSKI